MADKTTLNGSLEELGKLMASNLTTKGVPSTYDMGLTTLANRILLINGGGELTISLTSDKDILSYADSDSATLTATVLEDSSAVSGETVDFYRYVDGTNDVLLGSDVTDSNGEASYTYASTGVGDIQVYAKVRTLLTKTFAIQDCISAYADTKSNKWTTKGATGLTINSNGLTLANSNWANVTLTQQLQQGISIEYKITALGGSNTDKLYYNFGTVGGYFKTNSLMWDSTEISQSMVNTVIRFEIENNTIKIYLNDVLKVTDSFTATAFNMAFSNGSNRSGTIKDLLIKPL